MTASSLVTFLLLGLFEAARFLIQTTTGSDVFKLLVTVPIEGFHLDEFSIAEVSPEMAAGGTSRWSISFQIHAPVLIK